LRQIGTLPKRLDVKVLADYLLTLGMKTRVDEEADGWNVWVYNEDHFPRGREELQAYLNGPDDPRYQKAALAAEEIRRKQRELDQEFRKNYREVSDQWSYPGLRHRPLTVILAGICVVVFLLQETPSKGARIESTLSFSTSYIDRQMREHGSGLSDIVHGEVWRLITPIFLHFGIMHLRFNVWALSSFGTLIEVRRGTMRLAALVLVSALASNLGQYLYMERLEPGEPQLFGGISGVICALFGYIWMKGMYEPEQGMILHPNSVTVVLLWLGLCMTGLVGPIANAAHVVGLVVGVAAGVLRF
jgi:GlpG protein